MNVLGFELKQEFVKSMADMKVINNLINQFDGVKKKELRELFGKETVNQITYKIYKNDEEVGNIDFRDYYSAAPEIGVEIKEPFRRKGIAYALIKELMKMACADHKIDYFIWQVREKNEASMNLVKKLGGVFIKEVNTVEEIGPIFIYRIPPI